ncbi:MAG: N-6 DNA methylase [Abditibacteriota bacterium]|nr:N-6 DNA methylase [Abditibacteriota bacterium]
MKFLADNNIILKDVLYIDFPDSIDLSSLINKVDECDINSFSTILEYLYLVMTSRFGVYVIPKTEDLVKKLIINSNIDVNEIYNPCIDNGNFIFNLKDINCKYYGHINDRSKEWVIKVKLLLLDNSCENVIASSSITEPFFDNREFDCVICAPTIGIKINPTFFIHKLPSQGVEHIHNLFSEGLYVIDCINHLSDSGIGLIFVPNMFLFNLMNIEVREMLVKNNYIDSVISLGQIIDKSGVSLSLLVIRKNKKNKNIQFIDTCEEDNTKDLRKSILNTDINKVIEEYNSTEETENKVILPIDKISDSYILQVDNYLVKEKPNPIDTGRLYEDIRKLNKELAGNKVMFKYHLNEIRKLVESEVK